MSTITTERGINTQSLIAVSNTKSSAIVLLGTALDLESRNFDFQFQWNFRIYIQEEVHSALAIRYIMGLQPILHGQC